MAELYGYAEIYRPQIAKLRSLDKPSLLAMKELAASGCIECPNNGRYPNMLQALIDEKKMEAT